MRSKQHSHLSLLNLPRPLPDELLYSLIARSAVHAGCWSPKQLLHAVYGDRSKRPSADLPDGLSSLAPLASSAWGMNVNDLAFNHTLFPYYTHFMDDDQRTQVLKWLVLGGAHPHLQLGVCASGIQRTRYFRMCPACPAQDLQQYGETYWRRAHHLPGVLVCHTHGEWLIDTSVPFRPVGRHEHIRARPELSGAPSANAHFSDGARTIATEIARRSARLLIDPAAGGVEYRTRLRALGYVNHHGGPAQFRRAFSCAVPAQLLERMFISIAPDGAPTWLNVVRRKPRRALHPLKHVLMQMLLDAAAPKPPQVLPTRRRDERGKSLDPVLRAQASTLQDSGRSVRAIATRLEVDWKTANRLLQPIEQPIAAIAMREGHPDRTRWLELMTLWPALSRTSLRKCDPALYARLYRADRAWLLEHQCNAVARLPKQRVDWGARDAEWGAQVAATADSIKQLSPHVRASAARVLGVLQLRAPVLKNAERVPNTIAALEQHCEEVRAFHLRRLVCLISDHRGALLSDSMLLRSARINGARLSDGGRSLLQQARERVALR